MKIKKTGDNEQSCDTCIIKGASRLDVGAETLEDIKVTEDIKK